MKLTDFLEGVGRPVAYYPSMRKLTGSTNATILFCQFIYWRGKEADPNGWLEKTSEEIEGETGLSYEEQKTARRQLRDAELLEEHYARLDHQMRYRLNLSKINEKWAELQPQIPESGNPLFGKEASPSSLNSNTETTTEKNSIPQDYPMDWYVQHNLPIPEHLIEKARIEKDATGEFESAFGFGQLPWDSTSTWQKFKAWAVKIYLENNQVFRQYVAWRKGKGKYEAMSNKQIRMTPQAFMDTGYPAFMAHSVMNVTEEEMVRML